MSNKNPLDFFLDFMAANSDFPSVDREGNEPALRFTEDETSSIMEYHFPRSGENGVVRYHDGSLKGLFTDQLKEILDTQTVGVYWHKDALYAMIKESDLVPDHLVIGGYEFPARYIKQAVQGDVENGDIYELEVHLKLPYMKGVIYVTRVTNLVSTEQETTADPVAGQQAPGQEQDPAQYQEPDSQESVEQEQPKEEETPVEQQKKPQGNQNHNRNKQRN